MQHIIDSHAAYSINSQGYSVNNYGYTKGDNWAMKKPPRPWTKFQERLFFAMAKEGVDTPAELARKLRVRPQTAYKWWAGQTKTKNLRAVDVYRIGDALHVSARWLLGDRDDMRQGVRPTNEEMRVVALYNALKAQSGDWHTHWLEYGNDILGRLPHIPTLETPYPPTKKR